MTKDLLVIVPSRGRPHNAERLIEAFEVTGAFEVAQLVFAIEADDPEHDNYVIREEQNRSWALSYPEWQPMVHKLNAAADHLLTAYDYPYVMFMGDDHVPRTYGWARTYVAELRRMGTGVVYGDDLVQGERLCTQWAMSSSIVHTLGRMVPAPVEHMYCDNSIMDVARAAGCLKYLPDVKIEHAHPVAGRGAWDASYQKTNAREQYRKDHRAYMEWKNSRSGLTEDVDRVKALIFKQKLGTIGTVSALTKDRVVDGRRANGERCKHTTDQLGNTVTESADRQDVTIRAPHLITRTRTREERS